MFVGVGVGGGVAPKGSGDEASNLSISITPMNGVAAFQVSRCVWGGGGSHQKPAVKPSTQKQKLIFKLPQRAV